MSFRKRLSNRSSQRIFKKTVAKVHKKNVAPPSRGGIRL